MKIECETCIFEITKTDTGYHKHVIIKSNKTYRLPCKKGCDKLWCLKSASKIVEEVDANGSSENS